MVSTQRDTGVEIRHSGTQRDGDGNRDKEEEYNTRGLT